MRALSAPDFLSVKVDVAVVCEFAEAYTYKLLNEPPNRTVPVAVASLLETSKYPATGRYLVSASFWVCAPAITVSDFAIVC